MLLSILRLSGFVFALISAGAWLRAADPAPLPAGVAAFQRQYIQGLLAEPPAIGFAVAEQLFALDNGETLSREQFTQAWPAICRGAVKTPVTPERFWREAGLQARPAAADRALLANKRIQAVYQPQEGDLLCELAPGKDGGPAFVGDRKAFRFLIRLVNAQWTLIAIGG